MSELTIEDQLLLQELQNRWKSEISAAIMPVNKRLDALAQRTSRGPGAGPLEPAMLMPATLGQQLADNSAYQAFTKSVLTKNSNFVAELRLPTNRKAAVSGISPTEYLPQRIFGQAQFPLRLREIMPVMPVGSGTIEYTQETSFTPSAAVVPETTTKPTMAITFAEATAKCSTIASIVKVSKQSLMDVGLMNMWLSIRLSYSVNLKEEDVLINGDATNSIQGLLALAPSFAYVPQTGDQGMDVIGHAIGQLMGKGYSVDGVILNAADYTTMRLLKTSIGGYIFMGDAGRGPDDENIWEGTPLVWQVPMVVSPSMPAGQFLVGAFTQSTILFSRETLIIEIAFQNESDWVQNLACLRGELRSGLAVPVPAGLLKGTLPAGSLGTQAASGVINAKPIGK